MKHSFASSPVPLCLLQSNGHTQMVWLGWQHLMRFYFDFAFAHDLVFTRALGAVQGLIGAFDDIGNGVVFLQHADANTHGDVDPLIGVIHVDDIRFRGELFAEFARAVQGKF